MRGLKSVTGFALAALYGAAFVAVYLDYRSHVGQWFADLGLIMIALPFVATMRALSGGAFAMTGEDGGKLLAAAAFCCLLAFAVGATLEGIVRAVLRRLGRSAAPGRASRR
ncbi:MAG: hypothetical protein ABSG83_04890 [Roseiarcus sp.]|jgi:hypothetical protein